MTDYSEYYTYYNDKIAEVQKIEKEINTELANLNKLIENKENIVQVETKILKLLDNHKTLYQKLAEAYQSRNIPGGFPDREADKRQKEIDAFRINYDRMSKTLKEAKANKYKFHSDKYNEEYVPEEKMQAMNNRELLQYKDEKLKDQDKDLEVVLGDIKKGKKIANEVKDTLVQQNKQLEELQEDIDRTDSKMNKVTKKFEKFATNQKMCCLLVILVIEVIAAVAINVGFAELDKKN